MWYEISNFKKTEMGSVVPLLVVVLGHKRNLANLTTKLNSTVVLYILIYFYLSINTLRLKKLWLHLNIKWYSSSTSVSHTGYAVNGFRFTANNNISIIFKDI